MAGNKPIALIGGGTTMIGDPSGRTDMRKMLTKEDIAHNAACFKRQMEKFLSLIHIWAAGQSRTGQHRVLYLHEPRRSPEASGKDCLRR